MDDALVTYGSKADHNGADEVGGAMHVPVGLRSTHNKDEARSS
jgi:hypothetical protein